MDVYNRILKALPVYHGEIEELVLGRVFKI